MVLFTEKKEPPQEGSSKKTQNKNIGSVLVSTVELVWESFCKLLFGYYKS